MQKKLLVAVAIIMISSISLWTYISVFKSDVKVNYSMNLETIKTINQSIACPRIKNQLWDINKEERINALIREQYYEWCYLYYERGWELPIFPEAIDGRIPQCEGFIVGDAIISIIMSYSWFEPSVFGYKEQVSFNGFLIDVEKESVVTLGDLFTIDDEFIMMIKDMSIPVDYPLIDMSEEEAFAYYDRSRRSKVESLSTRSRMIENCKMTAHEYIKEKNTGIENKYSFWITDKGIIIGRSEDAYSLQLDYGTLTDKANGKRYNDIIRDAYNDKNIIILWND